MRITERKLRRVIRSVIAESEFAGTMSPEDPLEYFIEYEYPSLHRAHRGKMKFSEIMRALDRDGVGAHDTMDDVLVAIASKPEKYELQGCEVTFKDYVSDIGPQSGRSADYTMSRSYQEDLEDMSRNNLYMGDED